MVLWAYAELSLGTIASCLPVLPKFFRHFGPKIYGSFCHKFKTSNASRPNAKWVVDDRQPRNFEKDRHVGSKGSDFSKGDGNDRLHGIWSGTRPPSAKVNGEYFTLNGQDINLQQWSTGGDKNLNTLESTATKRDDLAVGHVFALSK